MGCSDHTVTDWKNFLRDICAEYFIANPVRLGGPNATVQIDESLFVRRKNNRGRMVAQQWVFGGIDEGNKLGFLVAVDARNAQTLLSVIQHGCFKMVFLEVKSENERFFYKKPHFSFDCNFFNIYAMFMK